MPPETQATVAQPGVRPVPSSGGENKRGKRRKIDAAELATWSPIAAFVILFLIFSIAKPDVWLTSQNLLSIVNNQAITVIVAVGLTVVCITDEIDISVAPMMSVTGLLGAGLVAGGLAVPWVIILLLLLGTAAGLLNGFVTTRFKVDSLIVTLAVGSVLDGVSQAYSGGETIYDGVTSDYTSIARWQIGEIQAPVIYALIIVVFLYFMLRNTASGRFIEAAGGNREAAKLAGVRTDKYLLLAFVIAGICAALAGMLATSRNGAAQPLFAANYLLPSIAAVFLGAATLRRGEFHILGTVFGVYLLAVGSTGFVILGAPYWTQTLFQGIVLLLATAGAAFFDQSTAGGMIRKLKPKRKKNAEGTAAA